MNLALTAPVSGMLVTTIIVVRPEAAHRNLRIVRITAGGTSSWMAPPRMRQNLSIEITIFVSNQPSLVAFQPTACERREGDGRQDAEQDQN